MAAIDDPKTLGRARLSFATEGDVDEFVQTLEKFEQGELGPDQWRSFRLLRGTYGQRQDGVQMIRIKIPQGLMDADQAPRLRRRRPSAGRAASATSPRGRTCSSTSSRWRTCRSCSTTSQAAGLTTREACGNSVRNITTSPYAGVHADEVFDVTPYGEALTRYFLGHPLSSKLPRKFKIAFEGCAADHIYAAINDIGWFAQIKDGVRGFRVTVGGGTSTMTRTGALLEPFIPASEMFNVAEAIVRVYHKHGDYQHKARNRMKWLIKSMGWDRFVEEYRHELAAFRGEGGATLPFDPQNPPVDVAPDWPRAEPPSVLDIITRVSRPQDLRGPGIVPVVQPDPGAERGAEGAVAKDQRAAAEAGRLRDGRGHDDPRRPHQPPAARPRRPRRGLQRRLDARHRRAEPAVPLGEGSATWTACTRGWPRPASASPAPTPSPTWSAARAPNRAASR